MYRINFYSYIRHSIGFYSIKFNQSEDIVMNYKKITVIMIALFITSGAAFAQTVKKEVADFISSVYSPRAFNTTQVSDAQIAEILKSAINAPSARNAQPWYFTVIKTNSLVKKVISASTDGNVLFVISGIDDAQREAAVALDCGLATENIFLAAQALGLGSRIYTNPINAINSGMKEELGIPAGYKAVAVVRVGNMDPVDATSSASTRKEAKDLVNYK